MTELEVTSKLTEARKLYKAGLKKAKGGFFSSPNPDEAEKLLIEGKNKLKSIRPPTKESTLLLLKICEALADVRFSMNFFHDAGNILEEAARISESVFGKEFGDIGKYYKSASEYWIMNKEYEKAAKALRQAGKIVGEYNIDKGIEYFDDSCKIEEEEKRYQLCHEFFDSSIKFTLKNKKYIKCIQFLEREIIQYEYELDKRLERIYRNICDIMLIHFHLKDTKSAQQRYYNALDKYNNLGSNNQSKLCETFLKAYETCDEELLQNIKKSGDLGTYLQGCFATFAKKLNMIDIKPLTIDTLNKQNEQIKKEIKQEIKQNMSDEVLISNNKNVKIDNETGAPDLLLNE